MRWVIKILYHFEHFLSVCIEYKTLIGSFVTVLTLLSNGCQAIREVFARYNWSLKKKNLFCPNFSKRWLKPPKKCPRKLLRGSPSIRQRLFSPQHRLPNLLLLKSPPPKMSLFRSTPSLLLTASKLLVRRSPVFQSCTATWKRGLAAAFDRSLPHLNIGTIGHVDHGKTTLTAVTCLFGLELIVGNHETSLRERRS